MNDDRGIDDDDNNSSSTNSSDCILDFANIDMQDVDFEEEEEPATNIDGVNSSDDVLELELSLLKGNFKETADKKKNKPDDDDEQLSRLVDLGSMIIEGKYIDALSSSDSSKFLFDESNNNNNNNNKTTGNNNNNNILNRIRERLSSKLKTMSQFVEAEFLAIAAFNLFLQLNYTGPTIDDDVTSSLDCINPHSCFDDCLNKKKDFVADKEEEETDQNKEESTATPAASSSSSSSSMAKQDDAKYHSTVLSELVVDGSWPCEVSVAPYLLLLARCILSTLSDPTSTSPGWSLLQEEEEQICELSPVFKQMAGKLVTCSLWSARTTVAHERLLLTREPTTRLWTETNTAFTKCNNLFRLSSTDASSSGQQKNNSMIDLQATTILEYGLACHHFGHTKKARAAFKDARDKSGLSIEVTGVEGKRTKFQRKATAQMTVLASSTSLAEIKKNPEGEEAIVPLSQNNSDPAAESSATKEDLVKSQMVALSEDNVLLERVKFEDDKANEVSFLSIRDQAILLAFCLDVKNSNPADGLTGEEMTAYLSRVLCHHDDWIVFSTALLERAWLEFEGTHTKERSILQMQALADQHTNRLTITQSTRKSVDELSPVQDRLKNVHSIVYPPRWHMLKDVADRYAELGIVTSAAELYSEIEYWDEAVICYRRAGKMKLAEEIVRKRLEKSETPSMWVALGDIINDPECYDKAISLSRGRYLQAFISSGKYSFDKGDLSKALENYRHALKLRPLQPNLWFRVGTIAMKLEDWELALTAFSEVVQQEPEEAEGWANVGAVHMHNNQPGEAYAALVESLKQNRNNWRVWENKLYVCLDLNKYDEAVQACDMLLDRRANELAEGKSVIEERCVRALVGGTVKEYVNAKEKQQQGGGNDDNTALLGSARRTLTRVHGLIERLIRKTNEAWMFEVAAYFNNAVGKDEEVYEYLMKEYRSLSSVRAWESDDIQTRKVCHVVSQIVQCSRGDKEKLIKSKFLIGGVVKRVEQSRFDKSKIPEELDHVRNLLKEVTEELKTMT